MRAVPAKWSSPDRLAVAALGVALAMFAWLAWSFRGYTPDDTYIFLRSAQNAAEGRGLTFNPHERVYGNTSLPWAALLAAATWAGLPALAVAKALGVVLAGLTIVIVQRLAWSVDPRAAIVAPLVMAGFLDLPYWGVSGMDTALFTCLVAAALLVTVRAADGASAAAAGLAWGLTAATRPEGLALGVIALAWLLVRGRWTRRQVVTVAAAFVLPIAAVALFAWAYYGDILPNTYWAKRYGRVDALRRGLVYMRAFVMANDGALMALAVLAAFVLTRARALWLCGAMVFFYIVYPLWIGGDSMFAPGSFRFVLPALAPLSVLMAVGLAGVWARVTAGTPSALAGAMAASVMALWLAFPSTAGMVVSRVGNEPQIVAHLREHAGPDDAVAVNDIGWVGYETGLRVIDTFGLVDPWIARALRKQGNGYVPGDAERLTDYVLALEPRWWILKGIRRPDGTLDVFDESGAQVMAGDARFVAQYRLVVAGTSQPYLLFERDAR
jgi:arabinofuranosyltransferase